MGEIYTINRNIYRTRERHTIEKPHIAEQSAWKKDLVSRT